MQFNLSSDKAISFRNIGNGKKFEKLSKILISKTTGGGDFKVVIIIP